MDDAQQEQLRKLKWACRRGMLELDIIFERYLSNEYPSATSAEQQSFRKLLGEQDQTLFDWLIKRETCDQPQFADIVNKLSVK